MDLLSLLGGFPMQQFSETKKMFIIRFMEFSETKLKFIIQLKGANKRELKLQECQCLKFENHI